jgi:hypothetical protein
MDLSREACAMRQYKVSLPDELYARLTAAIAKSGRSLSDEIRTRVEQSLDRDVVDKPTRDFLDRLVPMPAEIERELGVKWHKHAGAWETFLEAIRDELAQKQPQGDIAFGERPHQTTERDNPKELGMWIAMQLRLDPGYTNSQRRQMYEEMFRKEQEKKRKKQ